MSTAKWAPLGNLVVFAGSNTTLTQLQASHHIITSAIEATLPEHISLASYPNVKWSKLLINSVPTSATDILLAHSYEECHQALLHDNPFYCCLQITQLPSWVKKLSDYKPYSSSSLIVSFEDLDSSTLFSFIAARQPLWVQHCNGGIHAGLGKGQFRPRDVCPSIATHHRHIECNTSFLSIVSDCHTSFYIDPPHLPFFCFTLAAPKTPGRRKSDHARLDSRCHQCTPRPPTCQPCHARRARQLAA